MHFIEKIRQPILIIDEQFGIISINYRASDYFGYYRDELIHQNIVSIVESSQSVETSILRLLSEYTGNCGMVPITCKMKNGEKTDCFLSFCRITDDDGRENGYILRLLDNHDWDRLIEQYWLTPRECEITELLITGKCYSDIAEVLCISEATLKTHIHHIYRKVGVRNRVELSSVLLL